MAHRESIQNDELRFQLNGSDYFYNVSSSVGYGCRNKPEDVQLVQFFVNYAIVECQNQDPDWGSETVIKTPGLLEMDGRFGGKTWSAIKWFQKFVDGCVPDGMISSPDGTKFRTPKQGMIYTIYVLNYWYQSARPVTWRNITADPWLPTLLCQHLSGPLPDLV